MLAAIARDLKAVEAILRGVRIGKLHGSDAESQIDLKLRLLSFRLKPTPDIQAALSDFSAALAVYAKNLDNSLAAEKAQAELDKILDWLGLLRASLENATMPYAIRNEAEEFAIRTRRNLEFIIEGKRAGAKVHVVTQLTVSCSVALSPWEKNFADIVKSLTLNDLEAQGWPHWNISLGAQDCQTLGRLVNRLRNAIAHRRVTFSSDSGYMDEVDLEFEDQLPNAPNPHWRASISADQLLSFCIRFTTLIEAVVS